MHAQTASIDFSSIILEIANLKHRMFNEVVTTNSLCIYLQYVHAGWQWY